MNIAGIVVRTYPEHLAAVITSLRAEALCEVHFDDGRGTIIATIEGSGEDDAVRKMRSIMNIPHVIGADLAYTCSDDGEARAAYTDHVGNAVPDALREPQHDA